MKFVRESGDWSDDDWSCDKWPDGGSSGSDSSRGDSSRGDLSGDGWSVDDGSNDKWPGGASSEDDRSGDGRLNGWASVLLLEESAIKFLLISNFKIVLQHIIIQANDIRLAID